MEFFDKGIGVREILDNVTGVCDIKHFICKGELLIEVVLMGGNTFHLCRTQVFCEDIDTVDVVCANSFSYLEGELSIAAAAIEGDGVRVLFEHGEVSFFTLEVCLVQQIPDEPMSTYHYNQPVLAIQLTAQYERADCLREQLH